MSQRYFSPDLWEHHWYVDFAKGTVDFWICERQDKEMPNGKSFFGGCEIHSRHPLEDQPPDHSNCHALQGQPCWHDGSSLYAEPYVHNFNPNNIHHESMFQAAISFADGRFWSAEEDDK